MIGTVIPADMDLIGKLQPYTPTRSAPGQSSMGVR